MRIPDSGRRVKQREQVVTARQARRRFKLIRWAEVMEALDRFEGDFQRAAQDGVFDNVSASNLKSALRCLPGELACSVPMNW